MKKLATTLLALILCLGMLAGCGDSQTPDAPVADNDTPVSTPATPEETPEEPAPAPSDEPSEEPAPVPSEEPSEEPAPAPSEEPSGEPAPAPSEEPSEEPAPAPSEKPVEEPAPTTAPTTSSLPDIYKDLAAKLPSGTYGRISFTDVYNNLSYTFEQAYVLKGPWGTHDLVVKPGSSFTVEIISDDYYSEVPYICADYSWFEDMESNLYIVGLSEEFGAQFGTEITSGCVDTIFQSIYDTYGSEGGLILPIETFNEYEDEWGDWVREMYVIVPGSL